MRRLVCFTTSLGSGGAEKHAARVLAHLDPTRWEIELVVARGGGSYEQELPSHVRRTALGRPVRACVGPLRALLRARKPDLVWSVMDLPNCVALLAARGLAPVVASVQIPPSIEFGRLGLRGRVMLAAARLLYPRAVEVIALSEGVRGDLARVAPRARVTVVPNAGTDARVVALGAAEPACRPPSGDGPAFVACGRLTTQKGFDVLLDAFARVRATASCRLWLIGEGPDRAALEAQAARLGITDDLWMPGFLDNPYAVMHRADVFVLSSRWEGFGNVITEAMSVGTPVIATDCPWGPAEILRAPGSGLLVPPEDAGALAEAMARLCGDAALRQRIGAAGRAASAAYDAAHVAAAYDARFRAALTAGG